MKRIVTMNTEPGDVAKTVLAGYYKFYGATIARDFNGATAVKEYEEDSETEGSERD